MWAATSPPGSSRRSSPRSCGRPSRRCAEELKMTDQQNVVLVHGAFADGSSWSAVTEALQAKGYRVTAPQFPQTSLADDVARLRQALAWLDGPAIVAGHSYGGQGVT